MTGHRCPLCGTPGAACGAGSDVLGVPVGILAEEGWSIPGDVEYRWVLYNGQWRTYRINQQDPRYAESLPYTGEDSQPTWDDHLRNGDPQVSTVDEQKPEKPVQNKARTTTPGIRRTGAGTKRRGAKVEPTEQKEGGSA